MICLRGRAQPDPRHATWMAVGAHPALVSVTMASRMDCHTSWRRGQQLDLGPSVGVEADGGLVAKE